MGFRPINFWQKIVERDYIPTDEAKKLRYNNARLAGSVAAQQFYVMI